MVISSYNANAAMELATSFSVAVPAMVNAFVDLTYRAILVVTMAIMANNFRSGSEHVTKQTVTYAVNMRIMVAYYGCMAFHYAHNFKAV